MVKTNKNKHADKQKNQSIFLEQICSVLHIKVPAKLYQIGMWTKKVGAKCIPSRPAAIVIRPTFFEN